MNLLKRFKKDGHHDPEDAIARPERGIAQFRREISRAIDRAFRAFERDPWTAMADVPQWPPIDVSEGDTTIDIRFDLPGMEAKDVDVEVSGGRLTIRGSRQEERRDTGGGGSYRQERYVGSFSRTVTLPPYADADRVEAKFDKGVLRLTIPKIPGQGPKRVPVKAE